MIASHIGYTKKLKKKGGKKKKKTNHVISILECLKSETMSRKQRCLGDHNVRENVGKCTLSFLEYKKGDPYKLVTMLFRLFVWRVFQFKQRPLNVKWHFPLVTIMSCIDCANEVEDSCLKCQNLAFVDWTSYPSSWSTCV